MLALKTWREKAKGLPDLLEYAAVIDDGIVTTKSGAYLAAWIYEGPRHDLGLGDREESADGPRQRRTVGPG